MTVVVFNQVAFIGTVFVSREFPAFELVVVQPSHRSANNLLGANIVHDESLTDHDGHWYTLFFANTLKVSLSVSPLL
ncbi:hypothetical protein D3C71_2122300 [compost metagenome]